MPLAPRPETIDKPATVREAVTLVDAHVHIHDCFDLPSFFDHAFENFFRQASRVARAEAFNGTLMLTESAGVDRFSELRRELGASPAAAGRWEVRATDEDVSLQVERDGDRLFVVSGRQIVTSERLEVLALGMAGTIEDGLPIREVIAGVEASGAICVLPWGFGKWTGHRGRIIRELIDAHCGTNLFLGDNAGRLGFWSRPREFTTADARGIGILPGTDPLPWPGQVSAAAAFGSILDCGIGEATPFADIRRYLVDEHGPVNAYGELERLLPFVRHQIGMQLRKHL